MAPSNEVAKTVVLYMCHSRCVTINKGHKRVDSAALQQIMVMKYVERDIKQHTINLYSVDGKSDAEKFTGFNLIRLIYKIMFDDINDVFSSQRLRERERERESHQGTLLTETRVLCVI